MPNRQPNLRENRPWPDNPAHLELVDRTIRFNGHWGVSSSNQKPSVPPDRISEIHGKLHLYPGAPSLPALRRVKGDVLVEPGHRQSADLSDQAPSLQEIAGQLRVSRQARFPELRTVSKHLVLGQLAAVPKLNIVGETLEINFAPGSEIELHFPALRVVGKDILSPNRTSYPYRPVMVHLPVLKAVGGLIYEHGLALDLPAQRPLRSIGDDAYAIYRLWLLEDRHMRDATAMLPEDSGCIATEKRDLGL